MSCLFFVVLEDLRFLREVEKFCEGNLFSARTYVSTVLASFCPLIGPAPPKAIGGGGGGGGGQRPKAIRTGMQLLECVEEAKRYTGLLLQTTR